MDTLPSDADRSAAPSGLRPETVLKTARAVLVIDWPSKDIPESLARAGFDVFVRGGPGPRDFSRYERVGETVLSRPVGHAPERVDLVYAYRPLAELPQTIETALRLGAKVIWSQSGLSAAGVKDDRGCWVSDDERRSAHRLVEDAGLGLLMEPCIADAVRAIDGIR